MSKQIGSPCFLVLSVEIRFAPDGQICPKDQNDAALIFLSPTHAYARVFVCVCVCVFSRGVERE